MKRLLILRSNFTIMLIYIICNMYFFEDFYSTLLCILLYLTTLTFFFLWNYRLKNLNSSYYRYIVLLFSIIAWATSLTITSSRRDFERHLVLFLSQFYIFNCLHWFCYIMFAYNIKSKVYLLLTKLILKFLFYK